MDFFIFPRIPFYNAVLHKEIIYLSLFFLLIGEDHGGTVDNPRIIKKTISFDLPKDWNNQVISELKRVIRLNSQESRSSGCLSSIIALFILWLLITIL